MIYFIDDDEEHLELCDYYTGTGNKICSFGCHEEPRCQTERPWGGWPSGLGTHLPIGEI